MAYFRCGGDGMPAGLQSGMDAVLNKKFGTSTTYPASGWPDTVNLMGPLPEKTASGSVASFSDGADDVPISSGLFSFTPKQAGTGTPSPSNPRAISGYTGMTISQTGKNLLSCGSSDTQILNQVDFTADGKGRYTVSGTATGGSATFYVDLSTPYTIRTGDYLHIMNSAAAANCSLGLRTANSGIVAPAMSPANRIFSLASYVGQTVERLSIYVANGGTFEGTITPMIINNNVATTFEAYKAKTPIVDTFGATVYGGSRATDGTLTETYGIITFDGTQSILAANYGTGGYIQYACSTFGIDVDITGLIICNTYTDSTSSSVPYRIKAIESGGTKRIQFNDARLGDTITSKDAWNAWLSNNNVVIAYPLATPNTSTLPALDISTYYGANRFFCDTGNASITYRADIQLALNP